jgi:hypothetical protein
MGKVFNRELGMTPGQYRNKYQHSPTTNDE